MTTENESVAEQGKCPFTGRTRARTNREWWPNQLNVQILNQYAPRSIHRASRLTTHGSSTASTSAP